MGSLSHRLPPLLTDCCVTVGVGVVFVLLLPLLALAALTLRPLLLAIALVGLVVALCTPAFPEARRRKCGNER